MITTFILVAIFVGWILSFSINPSISREDEATEDSPNRGSDYFSKKDAKVVILALALFLCFAIPGFFLLKQQTNLYFCKQRFIAISTALSAYESENDGRLPAIFQDDGNGIPSVDSKGRPITWATTLVNLAGIDKFDPKKSFMCTNASFSQAAVTEGPNGEDLYMTDGMFVGVALKTVTNFTDPGNIIAIAETSNGGSFGSYDPYPILPNGTKEAANDAYEIGFATPSGYTYGSSFPGKSVTRLAFEDSGSGLNEDVSSGRHGTTSLALFLDGHFRQISTLDALHRNHWPIPSGQDQN